VSERGAKVRAQFDDDASFSPFFGDVVQVGAEVLSVVSVFVVGGGRGRSAVPPFRSPFQNGRVVLVFVFVSAVVLCVSFLSSSFLLFRMPSSRRVAVVRAHYVIDDRDAPFHESGVPLAEPRAAESCLGAAVVVGF